LRSPFKHLIDHPGSFIAAVLVFQRVPGPGTLNILRATADRGVGAGFASVAGTWLGGLGCLLAAASGLEALFRGQPEATQALKCAGALYLAWMGWKRVSRVGDLQRQLAGEQQRQGWARREQPQGQRGDGLDQVFGVVHKPSCRRRPGLPA
jgi:threonine/homoserine/homoserine lactone efflux protein